MRESFVFYRSFFEASKTLTPEQAADFYFAICTYALDGKVLELDNVGKALFSLIKPQLDANNKRYLNGLKGGHHGVKGGRPKTPKKPLNNPKETPNDNDNVNVNVNDNVNVYKKFAHLSISINEYKTLVDQFSKIKVDDILEQIENYKQNKKYKSLYLTAKNWLKKRENETEKKRVSDFDQERTFGVSL